ncbi:MAG: D-alanyl-D-alanine carboxypeptidase [Ruminococcaceae bacterium]|jgi:D-alanyl-D-alanine carboxypeptidase (penicillin-binding protein 5/6)|nr:D-alanyl-D-alanine carboxypeptidase [Oscillospiraceae bacterium]
MKIRRILSVFLLAVLLTGLLCVVPAQAIEDPDIQARAAMLVDADTGRVLYEKNGYTAQYPASITKVMVALLVLEAVDQGDLRMDQEITATESSLANLTPDSSTADIEAGETLTVEQLLYCMLLVSANETGDILGEAMYGSDTAMVEQMNRRAAELGCTNTHFANTSGLHDPNHYISPWDIYLIAREALKHDTFVTICSSKSYTVPETNMHQQRDLHTTNALISNWRSTGYLYEGATGIKTGTTQEAGHCLLASATRNGRTLISIVLGAGISSEEDGYRTMSFTETSRLFDWGFDNFTNLTVLEEEKLYAVPVELSKETNTVMVHPERTTQAVLPYDLDPEADLTYTLDLPTSVDAPVTAGEQLGTVTVSYNGQDYVTVPLLALNDVPVSRFLVGKRAVEAFFARSTVRIALVVLAVLIVLLLIWRLVRPRRRYGRGGRRSLHSSYRGRRR